MEDNPPLKYSDLTEKIIGAAIEVHKKLGPGFVEKLYHKAVARELKKQGLKLRSQVKIDVRYDKAKIGFQVVDFLVEDKVVVELKAAEKEIGLILNFAKSKLEIKRVVM